MKIGVPALCAGMAAVLLLFASPAAAADPENSVHATDTTVQMNPEQPGRDAAAAGKPSVMNMYFQGGYTVNANASRSGSRLESENSLRVFDHQANSFTLDLAQLVFSKDAAPDAVGFQLKLAAGETAKFIHARGLSGASLSSSLSPTQSGGGVDAFDLTEAYIRFIAPVAKGLRVDVGKMETFFGAETIEAKNNANYSRSLLFNYAVPFTHTGIRMSYDITDALRAGVHFVNGWDNALDNNTGKSLGLNIGYTTGELLSASLNYMTGPEQDDNTSNDRKLLDIVATIKPSKRLTVILNYDNGKENNVVPDVNAAWSGFAVIAKYDFNERYSLSARGESFNDKDGVRIVDGLSQRVMEMTVTSEIRLDSGLIVRPEYRHDASNTPSFENNTKKVQDTIALGLLYSW